MEVDIRFTTSKESQVEEGFLIKDKHFCGGYRVESFDRMRIYCIDIINIVDMSAPWDVYVEWPTNEKEN